MSGRLLDSSMVPTYSSIPAVQNKHNDPTLNISHPHARRGKFIALASAVLTFVAFSVVVINQNVRDAIFSSNLGVLTDNAQTLKPSNELERRTGRTLNDGLFETLVRVHSPTRLELESGKSAIFFVEKSPGSKEMIQLNQNPTSSLEYAFTDVGKHLVEVELKNDDGTTSSFVYTVTAKIIRIELRDLTEEDRHIYFDALRQFQYTSQAEGVATYGKTFKSLEYILRLHLYGAADRACDHWHDDAGMLNHHVAITWTFEQSLRKIDPRTASHYWDFTKDNNDEWYNSNIFKDDWFGNNSPNNALHILDKGHFAYAPISNGKHFSDIVNPYGLLRSPWNTNPTPYLLRYNKTFNAFADYYSEFPTCSQFANVVKSDLSEVINALNGELHGPVHIMIGGHWDSMQKWANSKLVKEYVGGDSFLLLSKFLWRQGYVRIPKSCSDDTPHSECRPSCPEGIVGAWDDMSSDDALEIFNKTGMIHLDPLLSYISSDTEVSYKDFLQELCHVGSPGEMFSSAAPQDPTFWPLHGNAERLVGAMRIYKNRGLIDFDETWGFEHQNEPSDTSVVCDWSGITGDTLEMPTCAKATCSGHKEFDLLPFTDLFKDQGDTLLTNAEFYEKISPLSDALPYAFDSLFFWDACEGHNLLVQYESDNSEDVTESVLASSWKRLSRSIWGVM